jgi:SAM-dependent methyltransferase
MSAATLDYPLQRDAAEHRRLAMQAEFWAADAAALFDLAGIGPGARVADLGCGTPHVALELARRVGPRGRVLALDSDRRLIDDMSSARLPAWLRPVHGDAYALPWENGTLDAVHARFVAAPCGRPDVLIAEMLRVLRPGGTLLLQEPDAESWLSPGGVAWERLRELIRRGFALRGGDFDAGRSLRARLRGALDSLGERRVAYGLPATHPYAALPLAFCAALEPTWRAATAAEADLAEREGLRERVAAALGHARAEARTFTLVQVWGRVPESRR